MQGVPTSFWGKLSLDAEGRAIEWHPLVDHCADVAAVCEALLTRTILRERLSELAARPLTDVDVARLSFIAALHDLGKHSIDFQNKAFPERTPKGGHVQPITQLLGAIETSNDPLIDRLSSLFAAAGLDRWGEGAHALLVAAISHHGRPEVPSAAGFDARVWRPAYGLDPIEDVADLIAEARRWFPLAFDQGAPPLPTPAPFAHAYAGILMLADWLGSDRRAFPFREPCDGDRIAFARTAAARVLDEMHLDPRLSRAGLGPDVPSFPSWAGGHAPRPAQRALLDASLHARGSLVVLEAETGAGKTEAALGHYLRLFHAGLVDGLYFALPTRTAVTQIHARVVRAVEAMFPEPSIRPPVVLAVPGYLAVDDDRGQRLPGFEVLWPDRQEARDRHRTWVAEAPKRFLAGAIAIGTIDQTLLSALPVDHAHLRHAALLRSLLVVDEVHASDAYMNRLTELLLEAQLAAGGHALLMSATLGVATRERFAQLATRGALPDTRFRPPALADALVAPYPAIASTPRRGPTAFVPIAPDARRKVVDIELFPIAADAVAIASLALDHASAGARVLVVRNTVREAVQLQGALERLAGASDPLLFRVGARCAAHHSRFARPDRIALDEAIESALGKHASRAQGLVAIATQTVQQSLDLDADLLITDLCPMDVLLQRIGRVHRHERADRASGYARARCVVLDPGALVERITPAGLPRSEHGLGSVYPDLRVLEATRELLVIASTGRSFVIPEHNRELVELTTHPEALAEIAARDPRMTAHGQRVDGRLSSERGLALTNRLQRDAYFGEYAFPDGELEELVSTRLGERDRRLVLPAPIAGAFGGSVTELRIPAWMARGLGADPELTVEPRGDGIVIRADALAFVYDRLGLRRLDVPRSDTEELADA